MRCDPPPAEILVHIDGGNQEVLRLTRDICPQAVCLISEQNQGPGGSLNRLIATAANNWVATFDDDARPLSSDYFTRVAHLIQAFPDAAIFGASSLSSDWAWPCEMKVGVYAGYASVFNKNWFSKTSGFVPLTFAYCMEEVDICPRLHALGGQVIQSPLLQVEHEADLPLNTVAFHSRALANIALFWYLRCPSLMAGRALFRLARRLIWLLTVCPGAIVPGLAAIPAHLRTHHHLRSPVPAKHLSDWLRLVKKSRPVSQSTL
jgi:GT2 family glycosyltransferase